MAREAYLFLRKRGRILTKEGNVPELDDISQTNRYKIKNLRMLYSYEEADVYEAELKRRPKGHKLTLPSELRSNRIVRDYLNKDSFTEKRIWFTHNGGKKTCGVLRYPKVNARFPLVIMVHGFLSSKDSGSYLGLAEKLSRAGFATFRFDYYAHGESQGSMKSFTLTKALNAVDAALEKARSFRVVDEDRISMLGSSMGGLLTLYRSDKVRSSALICPAVNFRELFDMRYSEKEIAYWKEKGYAEIFNYAKEKPEKLGFDYYRDAVNYDGYKKAENLETPVLITHGDKDKTVPVKQSRKLSKVLRNKKLFIVKGANHRFYPKKLRKPRDEKITEWFLEHG
ncbi:MAG: alpha/beta hydrolase family protein [Nanobdellota archaeon]